MYMQIIQIRRCNHLERMRLCIYSVVRCGFLKNTATEETQQYTCQNTCNHKWQPIYKCILECVNIDRAACHYTTGVCRTKDNALQNRHITATMAVRWWVSNDRSRRKLLFHLPSKEGDSRSRCDEEASRFPSCITRVFPASLTELYLSIRTLKKEKDPKRWGAATAPFQPLATRLISFKAIIYISSILFTNQDDNLHVRCSAYFIVSLKRKYFLNAFTLFVFIPTWNFRLWTTEINLGIYFTHFTKTRANGDRNNFKSSIQIVCTTVIIYGFRDMIVTVYSCFKAILVKCL